MNITHHLPENLLMAYAAGILPEAFSLAIATHISLCDTCRAGLAAYDALGGAVVEQGASCAMEDGALEAVLARLDALPPAPRAKPAAQQGMIPAPLAGFVGGDLASVKWRHIGMGVRQAILPTGKGATARLLYIPAGHAVPDHGHGGAELTLVLQGAFRDAANRFARGDIEVAGADDTHMPVADLGDDCICLAVTDAPLRFTALIPRLLQPLFRI